MRRSGFALVEMLVGLVVMAGLHQMFVSSLTAQTTTSSQMEADRRTQVAMAETTSALRQASPSGLLLASPILADRDPTHPDRIDCAGPRGADTEPPKGSGDVTHYRYWLDSGALKRSIGGSNYTGGSVLTTEVTKPAFTFYDAAGNVSSKRTQTVRAGVGLTIQDGSSWSVVGSAVRLRDTSCRAGTALSQRFQ